MTPNCDPLRHPYTAASAGDSDIVVMAQYGYKRLIEECGLVVAGTKCNTSAFDQLFKRVNARSENARALDRQEWLQALVRMACMRYVLPGGVESGKTDSVATALKQLLEADLSPNVDPRALHAMETFRHMMYNQDVDEMFRQSEGGLRAVFDVYALGDGQIGDELHSTKLLDYSEWRLLMMRARRARARAELLDPSTGPCAHTLTGTPTAPPSPPVCRRTVSE